MPVSTGFGFPADKGEKPDNEVKYSRTSRLIA